MIRRPSPLSIRGCALLCALFLSAVCVTPRAHASGFATIGFTPDHYSPVTTAPVAAYSNPAALSAGQGLRFLLDGTFAYRRASYVRTKSDTIEPSDAGGANTGEARLSNFFALPNFSTSMRLGDFSLGAGVFVPFGGALSWSENKAFAGNLSYPGAVDSSARWHSISGLWATGYATLAQAYEFKKIGLSIGLSENYVYTQIEISQGTTVVLDDNLNNEGRMYTKLTGSTGSFGLGAQWTFREQLWVGASYQAPPGLWRGQSLEGPLRTNYGSGVGKDTIRLNQDFPDILQLGARYRPDRRFEFRVTGNWQRFSSVRSQCLMRGKKACKVNEQTGRTSLNDSNGNPLKVQPFANFVRRWHDAFGARVAASAFMSQRWELFTALSWDGSAVPPSTLEPGLMDGNDIAVTLGTRFDVNSHLTLGASYMHQMMLPRDNTGKSRLSTGDYPNTLPSADGRYKQTVGVANLNMGLRF